MYKVAIRAISSFFGSKTPYKRHDGAQKLLLENLMLLISKGYFPLSTCENVWMCRLVLKFNSKPMSPTQRTLEEEIFPTMHYKKNKKFQLVFMIKF
jgi:hypothetical protein